MKEATPVLWFVVIGLILTYVVLAIALLQKSQSEPINATAEIKFYNQE